MHPDDDDSLSDLPSDASLDSSSDLSSEAAGDPVEPSTPEAGSVLPAARRADVFPAPGWDRYQSVRLLGQGGMGRVFLAYDPRLRRNVALKFLHSNAPVRTSRFFAEARAQARVQHDRVCKVFEVGEVQGKPFIAMQYVDGKSLRQLSPELTLEQKVRLLRDAAEGVHAAHRAGLIHRDLKPSNIMVERTEDGQLKPYVMDFGIARDWQGEGTATGAVLGTPQYMAPEQARGEVKELDRRADVYSLGATLYFLLTGKPPITGDNGLEVISRVNNLEPTPPRQVVPGLPAELESIVLKCLEKERAQRYDSARALAEDLDRYLDGEPVLARSTGRLYRLRKRLRKHKLLVGVVAASVLLVLLAGAQAVRARREAAERERLARRFTEQVEHIEARARYSGLSPLHDTRADRKALQQSMGQLEAEIARAGSLGEGPGRYALGRGHLALGDLPRAHEALRSAWEQGYQEPRVAYALALVLGRLYKEQRLEAEHLRSAELRDAELRRAEQRYRDPALRFLKLSEGSEVPSRPYVTALLAFYEGRLDEALRQLDTEGGAPPWFYEAPTLRGDVLVARAMQHWNQGEREAALADFEAGRTAYARAAAVGESVPEVYDALADLEYSATLVELYGKGDVTPRFARGMEAVQRARAANPEDYTARLLEARFQGRLAEYQLNVGADATEALQRSLEAAHAALALAPERAEARIELARNLRFGASMRQQRGLDPREQLTAALAALDEVPAKQRDYVFHTLHGLVSKVWADYEDEAGLDSLQHWAQAIEAYQAAIALDPEIADARINLGRAYLARARLPQQKDPDAELRLARAALESAQALSSKNVALPFQRAQVSELEALRLRDRGQDPIPRLREALELYRQGLEINARMPQLHNGQGLVHLALARAEWDAGRSPDAELKQAEASFLRAQEVAPQQGLAELNLGELYADRASYALARGEDPTPSVAQASRWGRRAAQQVPGFAAPWVTTARAQDLLAASLLERGRNPSAPLAQARDALHQAFERNPREAGAWGQLGETRALEARWQARRGGARAQHFEEAAEAFRRALELQPRSLEWRLAYGQLCRAWAQWLHGARQPPRPALERGLALAGEVLAARPGLAEARLLHASLLGVDAEVSEPPQREALLARARSELARGVSLNPRLRPPGSEPQGLQGGLTAVGPP
ncbi:protein kinase [Aggregicoccus sp. 17bor-14]|uniref:serine/threonine-protein kinase n=1 Tax=Myxococcaceae TaxID=31 RepID=UPI00129D1C63|nr:MULTISPECIES: serine/threonine-protein kinase [Myxococcaceae]MBF5045003.1 protein kinase [Simulacricoccus sp. 17bor-14]MRI90746.1 protein kinase [Aggregicoccus sp. 17bor-14]